MPSTPLMAFSRGAATVSSSTVAEAPGYTARTCTTGGAISGYWAMGSTRIAARPASAMKIEMTTAKIGRSMKNLENMAILGERGDRWSGRTVAARLHEHLLLRRCGVLRVTLWRRAGCTGRRRVRITD